MILGMKKEGKREGGERQSWFYSVYDTSRGG